MPFKRPPVDMLYPTGEGKNRDEYFLVQYDDIVISRVEQIFYALLQMPEERQKYPGLEAFGVIDPFQFYYDYAIMSPLQFLMKMDTEQKLQVEDYLETINKCLQMDTWRYCSKTMMLYALLQLSQTKFVKKIDFISQRLITHREFLHINSLIPENHDKLGFLQGDILKLIEDRDYYTTIILDDIGILIELLKDTEKYHLNRTLLLLRNSLSSMEITKIPGSDEDHYVEKYAQEIIDLTKGKTCKVGRFYPTLYEDGADHAVFKGTYRKEETKP